MGNSNESGWGPSRHLFSFLSHFLFSLLSYSFSVNQVISERFKTVKGQEDDLIPPPGSCRRETSSVRSDECWPKSRAGQRWLSSLLSGL